MATETATAMATAMATALNATLFPRNFGRHENLRLGRACTSALPLSRIEECLPRTGDIYRASNMLQDNLDRQQHDTTAVL